MPLSEIKLFECEHQRKGRRILAEILGWWLKQAGNDEQQVWGVIVESLKQIKEIRLARNIHDCYNIM